MIADDDYYDYDDDYDDYDDYAAPAPAPKPKPAVPAKKKNVVASTSAAAAAPKTAKPTTAAATTTTKLAAPKSPPPGFGAPVKAPSSPKPHVAAKPPKELADRQSSAKTPLTLVILGHVDAGKSTVTGHLLYLQTKGRRPQNYAWLLDEDPNERAHGVTMDIAVKQLATEHFSIVLQDAPGHADYVPAMITGTASADAALLVVDASDFGTAFDAGQLREHIYIARGLGVAQVLVCVNKMDMVDWSQQVYEEIRERLASFLVSQIGYKADRIRFVPVSGLTGDNVVKQSPAELTSWYKGPTLWKALDGFDAPVSQAKLLDKPLRLILSDVVGEQGRGVAVRGKVAQGWVSNGDQVVILPTGDVTSVQKIASLNMDGSVAEPTKSAGAGETIDLQLLGLDATRVNTGNIVVRDGARPPMASRCRAKVWVLEGLTIPIIRGATAIFHMHQLDVPCHLSNLLRTLKKDGTPLKERPRALTSNTQAVVELTLSIPIVMEAFTDCRAMGRFVLRRGGDSIAVGRIEEVL